MPIDYKYKTRSDEPIFKRNKIRSKLAISSEQLLRLIQRGIVYVWNCVFIYLKTKKFFFQLV